MDEGCARQRVRPTGREEQKQCCNILECEDMETWWMKKKEVEDLSIEKGKQEKERQEYER